LGDESAASDALLDSLDLSDAGAGDIDALLDEVAHVEAPADDLADAFGSPVLSDADLAAELEAATGVRDLSDFGLELAVEADPLADLDADLMADLDSVPAAEGGVLNSPWDLSGDLDSMLLKNGHM
jgi:hypothetical protein